MSQCVCPVFAAYANECSREGVIVNWRHSVSQCGKLSTVDIYNKHIITLQN